VIREAHSVEVAIVGGGVAGSTLAVVLARVGIDVAVVEREARFRDRVRGDCLFPWGAAELARLGLADVLPASGARPLPVWQTHEQRQPRPPYDWRWDVPTGDVVWGVDHPAVRETLLQCAADAGARVIRSAKGMRPARAANGTSNVPLEGVSNPSRLRARLAIAADGSASGARTWIGAATKRDPIHHVLGGCLLADIDLDPDAAHISRYEGAMALLFHHASGRARAYVVSQPEVARAMRGRVATTAFLEILQQAFPEGALSRARVVGPVAFFPGIDIFADRIVGEGIALIGDAAGANDPAQGEGLALAFRDVRK
jgi:2-polyprenyl-6-methoxyphenol hydroxylase-like FAD-dependent oxidoreductase